MLDEHAIFEDTDLDAPAARANDHDAVNALAAREKLSFGDDRAATSGIPTIAAALLLGLESGRTLDALRLCDEFGLLARLANLDHDVRLVISLTRLFARTTARATTNTGSIVVCLARLGTPVVGAPVVATTIVATSAVATTAVSTTIVSTTIVSAPTALSRKRRQRSNVRSLEQ
jgi:hypothetical protein